MLAVVVVDFAAVVVELGVVVVVLTAVVVEGSVARCEVPQEANDTAAATANAVDAGIRPRNQLAC